MNLKIYSFKGESVAGFDPQIAKEEDYPRGGYL